MARTNIDDSQQEKLSGPLRQEAADDLRGLMRQTRISQFVHRRHLMVKLGRGKWRINHHSREWHRRQDSGCLDTDMHRTTQGLLYTSLHTTRVLERWNCSGTGLSRCDRGDLPGTQSIEVEECPWYDSSIIFEFDARSHQTRATASELRSISSFRCSFSDKTWNWNRGCELATHKQGKLPFLSNETRVTEPLDPAPPRCSAGLQLHAVPRGTRQRVRYVSK